MFDFLFKRSSGKASTASASAQQKPATDKRTAPKTAVIEAGKAELVLAASQMARLHAQELLLRAQSNSDVANENALAQFISECEFADARLIAADGVQTRPVLTQVHHAMRNVDRRVAKLMQARLDALSVQERQQQQIQQCIDEASHLLQQASMAPNQVAQIDHAWQAIAVGADLAPQALVHQFEQVRAALAQRLAAQAALQRAVLDGLAALRALAADGSTESAANAAARLDQWAQQIQRFGAAAEAPSLPKHLLSQMAAEYAQSLQRVNALMRRDAALLARRNALAQWMEVPAASLDSAQLRQAWNDLPALPAAAGGEDDLQNQFDALLRQVRAAHAEAAPAAPAAPAAAKAVAAAGIAAAGAAAAGEQRMSVAEFVETLAAMEAALEQGALQQASQHDKVIRNRAPKRLSEQHGSQLAAVRAELARLSGWAKWGGNVSREELIKTVEQLAVQASSPSELARLVGSARDGWKVLDTQSGPAPKALWERFDAACTIAYAPAAAHFRQLAEERRQNVDKARALLAEIARFAHDSGVAGVADTDAVAAEDAAPDWKAVGAFCQRMQSAWRQCGPLDRKEKKALDAQFEAALQTLQQPLARRQETDIALCEQWIAEVAALDSGERGALDTLKAVQARWQERAKALPLPRKTEQLLWQRFRAACDAVFAERKQLQNVADAERQQHLTARIAVCEQLEHALADLAAAPAAVDETASAVQASIATLLRQAQSAWQASGEVPRAAVEQINQRYAAAVAALEQRQAGARRDANAALLGARRDKLLACQQLETALAGEAAAQAVDAEAWRRRWQALPVLPAPPLASAAGVAGAAGTDLGRALRSRSGGGRRGGRTPLLLRGRGRQPGTVVAGLAAAGN